jgi:predicted DNA binding CopG/RHH family protein
MNKDTVYIPLDSYEKKLESFLNKRDFKGSSKLKSTKNMLQEAAKRYVFLQKSKSVTLRLNREDIIRVKAKAKSNNMPYQTLIGTLIHKYVRGEASLNI